MMKYATGQLFESGVVNLVVGDARVPVHWDIVRMASRTVDAAFRAGGHADEMQLDATVDLDALDKVLCIAYRLPHDACASKDLYALVHVADVLDLVGDVRETLDDVLHFLCHRQQDTARFDTLSIAEAHSDRFPGLYTAAIKEVAAFLAYGNMNATTTHVRGKRTFSKHARGWLLPQMETLNGRTRTLVDRCVDILHIKSGRHRKDLASVQLDTYRMRITLEPKEITVDNTHIAAWQRINNDTGLRIEFENDVLYGTVVAAHVSWEITEDDDDMRVIWDAQTPGMTPEDMVSGKVAIEFDDNESIRAITGIAVDRCTLTVKDFVTWK